MINSRLALRRGDDDEDNDDGDVYGNDYRVCFTRCKEKYVQIKKRLNHQSVRKRIFRARFLLRATIEGVGRPTLVSGDRVGCISWE